MVQTNPEGRMHTLTPKKRCHDYASLPAGGIEKQTKKLSNN